MISLGLPAGPLQVLCLAAHPDDLEIGCGGTLLALCAGREVTVHSVLLTGSPERVREAEQAHELFLHGAAEVHLETHDFPDGSLPARWGEVKACLEDVATRVHPDVILAPRLDDAHQDHRMLAELVITSWRDALVLRYEIPKWDGDQGRVTHYVPLTAEQARAKVELLDKVYPSQVGRDWWDDELFLGLMRLRGVECRHRYAEGFLVDKATLDLSDSGR